MKIHAIRHFCAAAADRKYAGTAFFIFFTEKINNLIRKNHHQENARLRLMVFRGDGNILGDEVPVLNYIIESWPLTNKIQLDDIGLDIDIFTDARKSCDQFSNLKSNNYLPSVMAGLFAKKNKLHDAIILNAFERVCESAVANVFIVKNRDIFTPPLSEGCVAGVIRRCFLERFSLKNYAIVEKKISVEDLLNADEIFLTNSMQPIKWVQNFRDKIYGNEKISEIYKMVCKSF